MIEKRFITEEGAQGFFDGIAFVNDSSIVAQAPEWDGHQNNWVVRVCDEDGELYDAAPRVGNGVRGEQGDIIESITPGTAPCVDFGLALATAWNPTGWSAQKVSAAFKRLGVKPKGTVVWKLEDGDLANAKSYGMDAWEALLKHYKEVEGFSSSDSFTPPRRLTMTPEEAKADLEEENRQDRVRVLDQVIEHLRCMPINQLHGVDGFHIDELEEIRSEILRDESLGMDQQGDALVEARRYRKALCMTKERLAEIGSMSKACLDAVGYIIDPALAGQEPIGTRTGRVDCSKPNLSNKPKGYDGVVCDRCGRVAYDKTVGDPCERCPGDMWERSER